MADDYGQDPTTAGPLAAGDALAGYIDPLDALSGGDTDHDWFAVRLTAGHDYLLGLLLPTGLVITLRDASGARLAPTTGRARDPQLYLHANSAGTYYGDVGGYVFSLPAIGVISASYGPYTIQFRDLGTAALPRLQSDASTAALGIAWFGASPASGGWSSQNLYPRLVAQIDGDGRIDAEAPGFKIGDGLADIVGFGWAGTYVALGQADGTFGTAQPDVPGFATSPAAGGWTSQDIYPRVLGDVTGDGRTISWPLRMPAPRWRWHTISSRYKRAWPSGFNSGWWCVGRRRRVRISRGGSRRHCALYARPTGSASTR
jgi:hypothetical protein